MLVKERIHLATDCMRSFPSCSSFRTRGRGSMGNGVAFEYIRRVNCACHGGGGGHSRRMSSVAAVLRGANWRDRRVVASLIRNLLLRGKMEVVPNSQRSQHSNFRHSLNDDSTPNQQIRILDSKHIQTKKRVVIHYSLQMRSLRSKIGG